MLESTYVLSEDSDNIKDVLTKKLMTDFKKVRELGPGGLPPIGDISYTPNPNDPFPPLPPGERPIIDDFDLHNEYGIRNRPPVRNFRPLYASKKSTKCENNRPIV